MSVRHVTSGTGIALVLLVVGCGSRKDSPDESFADGLAHAEEGSWQAAIEAHSDALEGRPRWIDVYVNLGVAKAGFVNYAGAIRDYDEALRLDPEDTE